MVGPKFDHVKTTKTSVHKICNLVSVLVFGAVVVLLVVNWSILPDTVPIHFNVTGEADGWGSKYMLGILPVVTGGLYMLLTMLENKPHMYNYIVQITEQNAQKQFELARTTVNALKNVVTLLFSFMIVTTVYDAKETPIPYSNIVFILFFIIIFVIVIIQIIQSIKNK